MPLHNYLCPKCNKEFEEFCKIADLDKPIKCECGEVAERVVSLRQSSPTFTQKLYPYWDPSLNKRFDSPQERSVYLKKENMTEMPKKDGMSRKEVEKMYNCRIGYVDPRKMKYAQ